MVEIIKTESIAQTALYNLQQTARRLSLDAAILARILEPKEKIEITINPALSDGRTIHIKAFVVRHNDALGPAKGGIRMASSVTIDDITGLAMEMTWKTSLVGVPFGGGKSGIQFDPAGLAQDTKEIIMRSFTRGIRRHMGPEIYIPAPDMGTNEEDMGHVRDCIAYSNGTSITNGCFVTGKPVILGGIVGRREATGKGVVYTISAACDAMGLKEGDCRIAIQGFGNVGSVAAVEIAKLGTTVIGVSDISGGVINDDGIDIEALAEHVRATGGVKGFPDGLPATNQEVLQSNCDILIPAATQSQITAENAGKIKAKIIAEAANSPTTPAADEILNKRKIFVIPDILCNAGGVFVSYLEYTQETQREQMTLELVNERLGKRMREKFEEVHTYSRENKLSMRDSAMNIAVSRVVQGVYARGLLP
ncbi:MAG: Glu/Leu/Phe/Val dehydrogenase [Planctomycetota bacterium]